MSFASGVLGILPPWLEGPVGKAFFGSIGLSLDEVAQAALDAASIGWPGSTGDDAIAYVIEERALGDVPLPTASPAERRRLADAGWRVWAQAGTPSGLKAILNASGYPNVTVHERVGPWHHFSLVLAPPFPFDVAAVLPSVWDDGGTWDDGGVWPLDPLYDEKRRVRALVHRFAPANTTAAHITFQLTPQLAQVF